MTTGVAEPCTVKASWVQLRLRVIFPPIMLPFLAPQLTDPAFLRYPDIHGDKVVFTCEGDLWLGSLNSKKAIRLTRHEGQEIFARFSPDGEYIAFTGEYDGLPEVYVIPTQGGAPVRVTYRYDYAHPMGWSADGTQVLYRGRSFPRSFGLYLTPRGGGVETKLPLEFASHGTLTEGNLLAFTRFNRYDDAWFHYVGGMQNDIWVGDLKSKKFTQLTDMEGTCEFPAWTGSSISFVREHEATFQIFSVPAKGGRAKALGDKSSVEIRELNSGPGALIYEKGAGIAMLDLTSNKETLLKFDLASDLMYTRPFTVSAEDYFGEGSLTPTGKRVLAQSRGQIVSVPVGEGASQVWKAVSGHRLQMPTVSPNGEKVAYISDQGGEIQVWVADSDGSNPVQLTHRTKDQIKSLNWSPDSNYLTYYNSEMELRLLNVTTKEDVLIEENGAYDWYGIPHTFSPDSQWLAYQTIEPISNFGQIALRNIKSGKVTVIGNLLVDDSLPAFSRDGKYLAYVSRRLSSVSNDPLQNQLSSGPTQTLCLVLLTDKSENPLALKNSQEEEKPKKEDAAKQDKEGAGTDKETSAAPKEGETKIDFEGIEERTLVLPITANAVSTLDWTGDKLLYADQGQIKYYDLKAKSGGTVTSGMGFSLSADGKKMLIGNRVVDAGGKDIPGAMGRLNLGGLRLTIVPKAEWEQIYWDAWRLLRDYFYVENMHGNDWPAIGKKYAKYLPGIRSRDELDVLIRMMQAELGSSHQYLSPAAPRSQYERIGGAFLGIDVVADPVAGELKISNIIQGDGVDPSERSPLLVPGFDVKEGDYLLEVAGVALNDKSNYLSALSGRSGQIISVTVSSKADGSDKRTVYVKPVSSERRMRILEWAQANRDYVSNKTDGQIGYIYLQAMGDGDYEDFLRQYYPQREKKALIIDTRFNNGGYVQSMINRILAEKLTGFFNMRGAKYSWTRQGDYFSGPVACIINEFNVSCGEEFPHRFRDLGIGKIIGRRTYGGEVGSSPGWPLVDGGVVSVPDYGMWTPEDGWVIEGEGVSPDIDVPSDPNAFVQGRDPQIDKTIEVLLEEMKHKPKVIPIAPKDRVRVDRKHG